MEDDNRIITTDNDGNIETIETSDEPYNGLSHFVAEDYELECCLDNDLLRGIRYKTGSYTEDGIIENMKNPTRL
jgi:hypothetical protein